MNLMCVRNDNRDFSLTSPCLSSLRETIACDSGEFLNWIINAFFCCFLRLFLSTWPIIGLSLRDLFKWKVKNKIKRCFFVVCHRLFALHINETFVNIKTTKLLVRTVRQIRQRFILLSRACRLTLVLPAFPSV